MLDEVQWDVDAIVMLPKEGPKSVRESGIGL